MTDTEGCENTDRELWREREGDFYADSIHVTQHGGIGMNVGGHVIVKPIKEWHRIVCEHDGPGIKIVMGKRLCSACHKPIELGEFIVMERPKWWQIWKLPRLMHERCQDIAEARAANAKATPQSSD